MDTKNVKDIKIAKNSTQKVLSVSEILWQKKFLGPGPSKLIGGNLQAGFYGEVPTRDFIDGEQLASKIGLTKGERQNFWSPWLKFSYLGKIEFIAEMPFRHSISWDDINQANAVYGSRIIEIKGLKYKIRLIKGKAEGMQRDQTSAEGEINKNSEWNKLMLPIHVNAPSNWWYPNNVNSPTEKWGAGYTDEALVTSSSGGNGYYSWCQEYGSNNRYRLTRGRGAVSRSGHSPSGSNSVNFGWRPVLELVD